MSNLEPLKVFCTVCLARDVKAPATNVATSAEGSQWYECGAHGPKEHEEEFASGERVALEDLKEWRRRHGLYFPTRGEFLSE